METDMNTEQERRLDALLDKQAILELVHTYCRAADRHDHELMRTLYHEDAMDDHGSFFKGLAMAFIDKLPEIQAPMKILHHNVTTVNIILDGNHAEGEIYWTFIRSPVQTGQVTCSLVAAILIAMKNGMATGSSCTGRLSLTGPTCMIRPL
jgi:hypothetical protein